MGSSIIGDGRIEVEHDGQIPEHRVGLGDGEVVDHRRAGYGHLAARDERAVGVGHVVREVRRHEAVAEEVHLAGGRIDLRVGGHRRRQPPVEVVDALRAEVVGRQLVRVAHLAGGQELAAVPDRGHVALRRLPTGHALAEPGRRLVERRADVAVRVRDGLPSVEPDAVHHPVAEEPVRRDPGAGVRAVADVEARQLGRQRAHHLEAGALHLLRDGREPALEPPRLLRDRTAPSWADAAADDVSPVPELQPTRGARPAETHAERRQAQHLAPVHPLPSPHHLSDPTARPEALSRPRSSCAGSSPAAGRAHGWRWPATPRRCPAPRRRPPRSRRPA